MHFSQIVAHLQQRKLGDFYQQLGNYSYVAPHIW